MMYTAYWEIVNDFRDDYGETDSAEFETFEEALEWLGFRDAHSDYYCIIFKADGQVVHTGWMP